MDSPDKEWRRLAEHYAGMYDEELVALARDYRDLTETAQQALRNEMNTRGLGSPESPRLKTAGQQGSDTAAQRAPAPPAAQKARTMEQAQPAVPDPRVEVDRMRFAAHYATLGDDDLLDLADEMESLTQGAQLALGQELEKRDLGTVRAITEAQDEEEQDALERAEERMAADEDTEDAEDDSGTQRDYTWKVPLAEYGTREEAWQRAEMLRRAGIERWYADDTGCRLLVPADQFDEAQRAIAHPVPAEIVELSQTPVTEFEMPKCPRCHAADPVLIDTEPANKWLCESCGNEWTEEAVADAGA